MLGKVAFFYFLLTTFLFSNLFQLNLVFSATLLNCIVNAKGRSPCVENISTNGISVLSKFSVNREGGGFQLLNPWRIWAQSTEKTFKFTAWDFGIFFFSFFIWIFRLLLVYNRYEFVFPNPKKK